SAGVGETALDRLPGDDPGKVNSIDTRKLLPLMKTPGLPLHKLARQLRVDVYGTAATVPHTQQPAYYDGLIGKFCLEGCVVAATKVPGTASISSSFPSGTPQSTAQPPYSCSIGIEVGKGHLEK